MRCSDLHHSRQAEHALSGSGRGNTDCVHGSLLSIGELLRHTGDFMLTRFTRTVGLLLRHLGSKDKVVRRTMIQLMPRLAALNPSSFLRGCLEPTMESLLKSMEIQNIADTRLDLAPNTP